MVTHVIAITDYLIAGATEVSEPSGSISELFPPRTPFPEQVVRPSLYQILFLRLEFISERALNRFAPLRAVDTI